MKYQLTEEQIEYFRSITPLKVNGEIVPFKIVCEGKFYPDPRGKSDYVVYIKDFSCVATYAFESTKSKLQQHFVNFMANEFEGYLEDYQAILEQKTEKENQKNTLI